jgi:flagellar hook-basal body complex protein FliE
MDPIQEYALRQAVNGALSPNKDKPGIEEVGKEFGKIFENLLGGVNEMQHEAKQAADGLLTGEVTDVHQVMVAVNKADLSFKFLVEVRNKLVEAYQELMNKSR